jgi:voltage-gated potassium channel
MRTLIAKDLHDRAGSALYTVLLLCVVVIQYASIFELVTQRKAPDANIKTASGAVWYVIVTITTVGYGDKYPVTNAGRIVGVITMVVGVGLFGVLTGCLANVFLAPKSEQPVEAPAETREGPSAEPSSDQRAPEPAPLPASFGLTAQLDQLSAEVARLRRLLERSLAAQSSGPASAEGPPDTHAQDAAQDVQSP